MKKKKQTKLFMVVFAALAAWVIVQNLTREKVVSLTVPDNAGVSVLETVDNSLLCVFQDGQVVVWGWDVLSQTKADFRIVSDQAVVLDAEHIAAVNKEGKKILTVYNLPDGKKKKEISVGWDDQDVWLRISLDKKTIALVRRNAPDSKGSVLYEFLTFNIEQERTGSPVAVSIQQASEDFIDYAVDNNGILYAVGSQTDDGRIIALGLENGTVLWDISYENIKEFCSLAVSPDNRHIYAGNRDGILYKINAATGKIIKKIKLLEPGETRSITNDYSVLNLAFNDDGSCLSATMTPKAYLLRSDTDTVIYTDTPTENLTSKIAFSPGNQFFVTSDIRSSKPIKVWPFPEEK